MSLIFMPNDFRRRRVAAIQSGVVPPHSKAASEGRAQRAGIFLLLVLLILASSPMLSGQSFERRVDDIVSRTWLRVGPFRVIPGFAFRNFGLVSNIYGSAVGDAATSDFLITPSPKVDVYFILKRRLILSFTENPEYHIYLRNRRFNQFNNNYGAELSFPFLGPLVITGGFASQTSRHLPLAELDRQVETNTKKISVEVAYVTPRRLSWVLNGFAQELSYADILLEEAEGDTLSRNLNREEIGGQLEIRYEAFRASRLFLQFGYIQHDFPSAEAGWRDAETRSFLAGIRFPPQSALSGSVALGFKRFQPGDRSLPRYSGLTAQAQLGIRLGTDTALSLGYNRDTSFSSWSNVLYYLSDTFNAALTAGVSRILDVHLGGFITFLLYPRMNGEAGLSESGPPPGWADRYAGLQAGFSVPVWKNLRAGLTYSYWTRPSGFLGSGDGHLWSVSFRRK